MQEFNYMNTYFNIIYQNERAYMRDFLSYDYVQGFYHWLFNRGFDFESLSKISANDHYVLSKRTKAEDIDLIFHVGFISDVKRLQREYADDIHILYVPGIHHDQGISIDFQNYKGIHFYTIDKPFVEKDLSFYDPFSAFFCAMNHADVWPGFLIFNKEKQVFVSAHTKRELNDLLNHIERQDDLFLVYDNYQEDSYFLQLSDLHLGKNKRTKGLMQLYSSLDDIIPRMMSNQQLKVLITGDLMETPNRRNMYLANDVMNSLKKRYKANVTFVLGNHDVIVHGFNMARNQKSKVIAYLLGESIKVIENEKMIIIKIDTTSEGNLARGKVGQRQLDEIDDELAAIENLEDYTLVAMLHHHVLPISKAQFIKSKWHERTFINRIVETSKVLVDATLLIRWLDEKHIHYVFHGHKHLPFFRREKNHYYIGAGSATGGLKESQSRYISYNVVKFNRAEHKMKTCMIFYDDKAKSERQRVEVYLFKEENHEDC